MAISSIMVKTEEVSTEKPRGKEIQNISPHKSLLWSSRALAYFKFHMTALQIFKDDYHITCQCSLFQAKLTPIPEVFFTVLF